MTRDGWGLVILAYLAGRAQSTSLFKWPWEGTSQHGGHGAPVLTKGPGVVLPPHTPVPDVPHDAKLMTTSTAVPWHEATPAGLPPWPTGWVSVPHPTQAMVQRAWSLMGTMPMNGTKYEQGPSGWLAYHKSKHPDGKVYVTVWQPKGGSLLAT